MDDNDTVLTIGVGKGSLEMVQLLLAKEADVNMPYCKQKTRSYNTMQYSTVQYSTVHKLY